MLRRPNSSDEIIVVVTFIWLYYVCFHMQASQASLPVNIQPLSFPGIAHSHTFSALDDFPKSVAWTFSQGSTPMSMDFHPAQQTLLLGRVNWIRYICYT